MPYQFLTENKIEAFAPQEGEWRHDEDVLMLSVTACSWELMIVHPGEAGCGQPPCGKSLNSIVPAHGTSHHVVQVPGPA